MSSTPPVQVRHHDDGAFAHFVIGGSPGNILNAETVEALRDAVRAEGERPELKSLLLEGDGKHFSFGASVEEHLPDQVAGMLGGFHALFRDLIALHVPVLAVVRGQCLGGGLELAAFCHRVFAQPDAKLGQPEVKLGVFAPVGSVLLPQRVGRAHADDLLLSGRVIGAEDALSIGLIDEIAHDPTEAALTYARGNFGKGSAASLRMATKAARLAYDRTFLRDIDALERLYLDELMKLRDPEEGLRAFLEKRQPAWNDA